MPSTASLMSVQIAQYWYIVVALGVLMALYGIWKAWDHGIWIFSQSEKFWIGTGIIVMAVGGLTYTYSRASTLSAISSS